MVLFHVMIEDTLVGNIVAEYDVTSKDELYYEVNLFDGSRYLALEEQASALKNKPVGTSVAQEYPVYNSFRKFGTTMEEKYNFLITIFKIG